MTGLASPVAATAATISLTTIRPRLKTTATSKAGYVPSSKCLSHKHLGGGPRKCLHHNDLRTLARVVPTVRAKKRKINRQKGLTF